MGLVDKLKAKLKLANRKREKVEKLAVYFPKEEIERIRKLVKKGDAFIDVIRLPLSFYISGENIIAQISSPVHDFSGHNLQIRNRHFSKMYYEFSSRAFDILQNVIASEYLSNVEEKQAALAALFSDDLKVLYLGHSKEIINSLKRFSQVEFAEIKGDVALPKGNFVARALASYYPDEEYVRKYDLLFKITPPKLGVSMEDFLNESGDTDFISGYINLARQIEVSYSSKFDRFIEAFVEKNVELKRDRHRLSESIIKLAKAFARIELRREVSNKDLVRAFRVASKTK